MSTPSTIVKSGSFSGIRDSSDSSTESMTLLKNLDETILGNADNTDSEESRKVAISFRLGPDAGAVTSLGIT